MNVLINCKICNIALSGKQTMYCSQKCKNMNHQSYSAQKSRGFKRKLELVTKLGGQCSVCSYKKNLSALSFHHRNPEEKEFQLDVRSLSNRVLKKILLEVAKCELVCHNCHAELHYPEYDLASLPQADCSNH